MEGNKEFRVNRLTDERNEDEEAILRMQLDFLNTVRYGANAGEGMREAAAKEAGVLEMRLFQLENLSEV